MLNEEMLAVVYNPSITVREYVTARFKDTNVRVLHWNKSRRVFEETQTESFCYNNPDGALECELITLTSIAPLSFEVYRYSIDANVSYQIQSTGFDGLYPDGEGSAEAEPDNSGTS